MSYLTAEIIAIGEEMISGARLDTNTQWLSRRLGELGVEVQFHTTIGDTLSFNTDAFRLASSRAELVIATGGLGPTQDDLTRDAIAECVGLPLELDESSLQHIESIFATRHREMPDRNRRQAMFPAGARPIHNPQGTAPGVDIVVKRDDGTESRIFALPGVPAEMKTMFDQSVAPAILASTADSRRHIRHQVMKFFGVGESDMEQRLGDMIARDREPRVGITVSNATISLRITARGESKNECQVAIDETRREIMDRVGELYFGEGETFEQQDAINATLRDRGERLVVVELGYAAPIGNWMAQLGDSPVLSAGLSLRSRADLHHFVDEKSSWPDVLRSLQHPMDATWVLAVDAYPDLSATGDEVVAAQPVSFTVVDPGGGIQEKANRLGGHPSIIHPRMGKAGLAWLRSCLSADEVNRSESSNP
ncbi:MAG: molybdopterin-binding protein [Planctomycetota bacterium]